MKVKKVLAVGALVVAAVAVSAAPASASITPDERCITVQRCAQE